MALGVAIKIIQTVIKYRHGIYRVITAQDKAISQSMRIGGYGKAASYGVRTGAGAGALIGSLITDYAPDSPGNGIQTTIPKRPTPSKPDKTRSGYSIGNGSRYRRNTKSDYCARQPYSRKCQRRSKRMYN